MTGGLGGSCRPALAACYEPPAIIIILLQLQQGSELFRLGLGLDSEQNARFWCGPHQRQMPLPAISSNPSLTQPQWSVRFGCLHLLPNCKSRQARWKRLTTVSLKKLVFCLPDSRKISVPYQSHCA
eukprot:373654-Rhodomonas_salina.1